MKARGDEMLEYLYQALASPLGIKLECSNVKAVQQKLYAARRASLDPALDALSLVPSPTDSRILWIVKNGKAQGNQQALESDS